MAKRHILCIGAHPDDNEFSVGGTAALFRQRGDAVHFVSVTNGDRGHYYEEYIKHPSFLAERRLHEARAGASVIGATYETLGVRDGEVYVDKPTTEAMIRCIRSFGKAGTGPDLVLFNRPQDYHRDHRYASQLVLDATYMLTVPTMCPETRHLDRMPVFAYWYDDFNEVAAFRADVVVPVDSVMDLKTEALSAHVSQVFEWLPYNGGTLEKVPPKSDPEGRKRMVREWLERRGKWRREKTNAVLEAQGGGADVQNVEAFQICQYGRVPSAEEIRELFPIGGV